MSTLSKRMIGTIAGLVAGFLAGTSHAALIEVNDPTFGISPDGFNITRDTATGLDWLDVSLTDSTPFATVDAGPLTPTWRRATNAEVASLFVSAGLVHPMTNAVLDDFAVNLGNPSSLNDENVTQAQFEAIFIKADALVRMLGVTGGNNANRYQSIGTTADPDPISPAANAVAIVDVLYSPFVQAPPGGCLGVIAGPGCGIQAVGLFIPLDGSGIGDNGARGDTGHFLVRNSPVAGIPEPAALALFGLGLAALGFTARRRR